MRSPAFLLAGVLVVSCGSATAHEAPPTFSMWSAPYELPAGRYIKLGLPDTFTVRIALTASTPVRARVMSLDEFSRFAVGGRDVGMTYGPSTAIDFTFHETEGCAEYVLVIDAERDTRITPNITITHSPATGYTGVCSP